MGWTRCRPLRLEECAFQWSSGCSCLACHASTVRHLARPKESQVHRTPVQDHDPTGTSGGTSDADEAGVDR